MGFAYHVANAISISLFLYYGLLCLFADGMVDESERYGLARFCRFTWGHVNPCVLYRSRVGVAIRTRARSIHAQAPFRGGRARSSSRALRTAWSKL